MGRRNTYILIQKHGNLLGSYEEGMRKCISQQKKDIG